MEIVYVLAPLALILALTAILGFLWAVSKGQYDDLDTPAHRMLIDDEETHAVKKKNINRKPDSKKRT